ncbi:tRNA (5-methylaminomethyl-2-thiouridine)(34)-methyltransferase MnmD [Merismopedia glauca]|nr:MnmC family methyltransferase [Merismopedia glauca]
MNLNVPDRQTYTPEITADGSFTFFSSEFGETFHSHQGAHAEALLKFIEPTQLRQKARMDRLCLLDICYGLGYNTAVAIEAIWQINPDCVVEVVALESDIAVPQAAIAHLTDAAQLETRRRQMDLQNPDRTGDGESKIHNPTSKMGSVSFWDDLEVQSILKALATVQAVRTPKLYAQLLVGDARKTLKEVKNSGFLADAIFLDPFSPPRCPQLWTVEFISLVSQCLKPDGRLATYSCAAAVRQALLSAKLHIGATNPVGRRSPGTVASFSATNLPPLSLQEQEHLLTRAAVPYRDPYLQDSRENILKQREVAQQNSPLEPTSRWKKRWG